MHFIGSTSPYIDDKICIHPRWIADTTLISQVSQALYHHYYIKPASSTIRSMVLDSASTLLVSSPYICGKYVSVLDY